MKSKAAAGFASEVPCRGVAKVAAACSGAPSSPTRLGHPPGTASTASGTMHHPRASGGSQRPPAQQITAGSRRAAAVGPARLELGYTLHCPVGGSMDGLDEVGGPGVQWGFQQPPAQLDSKTACRWPQHSDHPWMVAPATAAHGNHSACKTSEQQRTQTTPFAASAPAMLAQPRRRDRPTTQPAHQPASRKPAGSHLHPSVLPSPEARSAPSTPNIKHCLVSRAASRTASNIRPKQYMPQCLANAALATR